MSASVDVPLQSAELCRLVAEVEPAAVLAPARLLRRIIKQDRKLTMIGLRVPHRKSYVISRDALLNLVDRDELEIGAERELADTVLLLARPDTEELAALPRAEVLLQIWRLLFHARVHQAIAKRFAEHRLTRALMHARIQRIGRTEFDEIRTVLQQENFLLPPRDEATVYEEFAAVYLELRYFAQPLLARMFPGLADVEGIEEILAEDVDGAALFAATRLPGAPDSVFVMEEAEEEAVGPACQTGPADTSVPVDQVRLVKPDLLTRADKAHAAGNMVRAAIIRTRAADQEGTQGELNSLVERMKAALSLGDEEAQAWRQVLPVLLVPAARGIWPQEARLLYDLQKVCIDHERPTYSLEIGEWAYSGFRQPLVRPLPNQSLLLAVKHLRSAVSRLPAVRVTNADRHALSGLLHNALHHAEVRLRERFRPILAEALHAVGLDPQNFPERIARDKLVEELLDLVAERGFLTMGDLRDALSRNQLKLPDLGRAGDFIRGDLLIRGNRELAERAAGVYRRGPIYLRWLQQLSALAFGTRPGRWLTLFLFLPFGGAFATIIMVQEIEHLLGLSRHHKPAALAITAGAPAALPQHHIDWAFLGITTGVLGFFYVLLLHLPPFRRAVGRGLALIWLTVRTVLVDFPGQILRLPAVRAFLDSMAFLLVWRFVLKPLPVAMVMWLVLLWLGVDSSHAALGGVIALLAVSAFVNSRQGRRLEDLAIDWAAHRWEHVRGLIPGLFRLVVDFFKSILEAIDRGLYTVDEWLRFRQGQGRRMLAVKIALGFFWTIVSYFVRLFVNVFIEPTVNPLKHFPAVTVAAKLLVPFWIPLTTLFATPLMFLGRPLALSVAFLLLHSLPGAAGFLVWELKENWRLYRANRPRNLEPVPIGHHGETMLRLLKPGFHSGTLPKLYAKLRRAERRAFRIGTWRSALKLRENLHHVEDSIRRFTERELLAFLPLVGCVAGPPIPSSSNQPEERTGNAPYGKSAIHLVTVEAGSNRIRLELACAAAAEANLELKFEEQAGWLLAHVSRSGWLAQLGSPEKEIFTVALTGFFKKAGVDLLREEIEQCFAPESPPYDIAAEGLVVWPGKDYEAEVVYDLSEGPVLHPRPVEGQPPMMMPQLKADELLFRNRPFAWQQWVDAWENEGNRG
jgi:hypothetical protein